MLDWDDYSLHDLVTLEEQDDQIRYMAKTLTAFKAVEAIYMLKEERDIEASEEHRIVLFYLRKLYKTFNLLRKKYLFHATDRLRIDKSDSGFANFYEISLLESGLQTHSEESVRKVTGYALKEKIVSSLVSNNPVSKELLAELAQWQYLNGLRRDDLFLFFNAGTLVFRGQAPTEKRKFFYHWSCYDKSTNRPYIYLLDFEQDSEAPYLLENKEAFDQFLQVIRSEGMRAPAAGLVAMAIDQRLEHIHPKMLKRICLGPIYSPSFSVGLSDDVLRVLNTGDKGKQFVFHLTEQFVFSIGQTIIQDRRTLGKLVAAERVRERFYMPGPADIDSLAEFHELEEQKASIIRKTVLMPYKIHQHAEDVFKGFHIISFTRNGSINGV